MRMKDLNKVSKRWKENTLRSSLFMTKIRHYGKVDAVSLNNKKIKPNKIFKKPQGNLK
jgi:hypothetical protein